MEKNTNLNWDAFLERLTQLAKTQYQSYWNLIGYKEQVKQYVSSYKINDKNYLKIFIRNNEIIIESMRSINTPGKKRNL